MTESKLIEQISQTDGGNGTDSVGQQCAGKRRPDLGYFNRTEINRQHIKSGFAGPLNHTGDESGKTVGAVGLHGFNHHCPRSAAGKRFHYCGRQCRNESGIHSQSGKKLFKAPNNIVEAAGSAENGNSHQH